MSGKNNVLTIRVPRDLKEKIEKAADQQGVSMNQFAIYAFTRGISDLETAAFFHGQIAGKTRRDMIKEFDETMKQVPRKRVPAWDRVDA
jgi:hypothetical protein